MLSVFEVRDAVLNALCDYINTALLVQKIERTQHEQQEIISIAITLDSVQKLSLVIYDSDIEIFCNEKWRHRSSMYDDDEEHFENANKMQSIWLSEITEKIKAIFMNSLRLDYVTRGGFLSSIRAYYIPLDSNKWTLLSSGFYWHSPLLAIFPNKKVQTEVISFQQR